MRGQPSQCLAHYGDLYVVVWNDGDCCIVPLAPLLQPWKGSWKTDSFNKSKQYKGRSQHLANMSEFRFILNDSDK